jgi:hypothetical protein
MTLAIPEELKKDMDKMPFINWSEVARAAIKERIIQFQVFESIAKKSKLTEKDAIELGRKINRGLAQRARDLAKKTREEA